MNGNYDSENNFNYNGNNINDKSDNNLKNTEEPGQYSSDSFYVIIPEQATYTKMYRAITPMKI